jgi:hypothetical protein
MSSENPGLGNRLPRIIVRFHASWLIFIALLALTIASLGWHGWGPYQILAEQPWGYIGLYQAYLLMIVIATVAWIGSLRWDGRLWNALLLFAEMVPMSIILIAAPVLVALGQQGKALLSAMIHLPMITLVVWLISSPVCKHLYANVTFNVLCKPCHLLATSAYRRST